MRRFISKQLEWLFILLAVLFLFVLLRSQWESLRQHSWQLEGRWFSITLLLLLFSWLLEVKIWQRLLAQVGGHLDYGRAFVIWFLSAIMRYIPGNIWQPMSMTLRCQRLGIRPEATLTSVALYQAITLLAVVPLCPLYLSIVGDSHRFSQWLQNIGPWLLLLTIVGLLLLFIYPNVWVALLNWGLRRIGRTPLPFTLSRAALGQIYLLATLNWLLWGLTFAALTFALSPYAITEQLALAPSIILAYPIAYAIGFLSFITPSGFGVREGALYWLLEPLLGGGIVTVAALAMRILTTIGEFVLAGWCWLTTTTD